MSTKITYTILSLLFAVVGWVWSMTYSRLTSMEKELIAIKIELVKVQATIVDRDEVVRIVKEHLKK